MEKIYTPNIITPNFDGVNDSFEIFGKNFTIVSIKIYDRWGNLVFKGDANKNKWNGLWKNKQCPSGVYVYTITFTNPEGIKKLKKDILR